MKSKIQRFQKIIVKRVRGARGVLFDIRGTKYEVRFENISIRLSTTTRSPLEIEDSTIPKNNSKESLEGLGVCDSKITIIFTNPNPNSNDKTKNHPLQPKANCTSKKAPQRIYRNRNLPLVKTKK